MSQDVSGPGQYQKVNPRCYTHADVLKHFRPIVELKQLRKLWDVELRCHMFGNPLDPTFEAVNIGDVELPGFARGPFTVRMHKKLHRTLVAAFTEIQNLGLAYKLWPMGEGAQYCFRYTDKNVELLRSRKEYAGITSNFKAAMARRDRELGLSKEVVGNKPKFHRLSRHSWGIAIDLNPSTNPMKTGARFDIPYDIVKVMSRHGFHWGGYYENDAHDYMHFEYGFDTIEAVNVEETSSVAFPFGAGQTRQSPLKHYARAESQEGGFYPLGMFQNIHAGVHLTPPPRVTGNQPVHALLPGYVVAARLVDCDHAGGDPGMIRTITGGQSLGFVLLRHDLYDEAEVEAAAREAKEKKTEPKPPKPHVLYSLYMHLIAPEWGQQLASPTADRTTDRPASFLDVPWLAALLQMQFGAVVDLNPASSTFGRTFWSIKSATKDDTQFEVFGREKILANIDGVRCALFKPTPPEVTQAIEAFHKGSTVTFDSEVFHVACGESVGLVPAGKPLHWEVFSLGGADGGIQLIRQQAGALDIKLVDAKEAEGKQDNFLTMPNQLRPGDGTNEVKEFLGASGSDIVNSLADDGYAPILLRHMQDDKTLPAAVPVRAPRTYLLKLQLNNPTKYKGTAAGGFEIEVEYFADGVSLGSPQLVKVTNINKTQANVSLDVPVGADEIELWSKHVFIEPVTAKDGKKEEETRSKARFALCKAATPHRFRDVVVEHVDEWTPDGLDAALKTRNEAGMLWELVPGLRAGKLPDSELDKVKKGLRPLSWWARPEDEEFGEVLFHGKDGASVFGTGDHQLPPDARIVNMHPVSAAWLLDLLLEAKRIRVRNQWPEIHLRKGADTTKPPFLGMPFDGKTMRTGVSSFPVLVQHGFGTGATEITFTLTLGERKLEIGRARLQDGVAFVARPFPAWGKWQLSASEESTEGRQELSAAQTVNLSGTVPMPELLSDTFDLRLHAPVTKGKKAAKVEVPPPAMGVLTAVKACPAVLAGYVTFDCWRAPAGASPDLGTPPLQPEVAVPVAAKVQKEDDTKRTVGGLMFRSGFIIGKSNDRAGSKARVTRSFSFMDFIKGPDGAPVFASDVNEFLLAVPLANRLQALHDRCLDKKAGTPTRIRLRRLSENGRVLDVAPASRKREDCNVIAAQASKLPASFFFSHEVVDGDPPVVRLTYKKTEDNGLLDFELDAGEALGVVAAQLLPEDDGSRLHVRPRFLAPNGGHFVLQQTAEREEGTGYVHVGADAIRKACGETKEDLIDLPADELFPPIDRMAFGTMKCRMDRERVYTEVPLVGPIAEWQAGSPRIRMTVGEASVLAGTIRGKTLMADWDLLDRKRKNRPMPDRWGNVMRFTTEFLHPEAMTAIPAGCSGEIDLQPQIESLTWEAQGDKISLRGQARAVLTSAQFRIEVERELDREWKLQPTVIARIQYGRSDMAHLGRCASDSSFQAWIALKYFQEPGRYRFRWKLVLPVVTSSNDEHAPAVPKKTEVMSGPMTLTAGPPSKRGRTWMVEKL
jgi:hypothetical protein